MLVLREELCYPRCIMQSHRKQVRTESYHFAALHSSHLQSMSDSFHSPVLWRRLSIHRMEERQRWVRSGVSGLSVWRQRHLRWILEYVCQSNGKGLGAGVVVEPPREVVVLAQFLKVISLKLIARR